jgi:ribA/ribD-fused uncharacterized protein
LVEAFFEARSAHDAYTIAKAKGDKAPGKWDEIKLDIMYEICKLKMIQNSYVLEKLSLSGDLDMVEDSPKDAFWSWGPNRDGRNELGKIWMKLRNEIRSGEIILE